MRCTCMQRLSDGEVDCLRGDISIQFLSLDSRQMTDGQTDCFTHVRE